MKLKALGMCIGCDLSYAKYSGADLSDVDLWGVNLKGANLKGANLAGADLTATNLMRVDFTGANLKDLKGRNDHKDSDANNSLDNKLNSKELIFEDVDKNADGFISKEEFQIFTGNLD